MKLTKRQQEVYDVLDLNFSLTSGQVARAAFITTRSPSETAAKYLIQITKLGLAVQTGTRMYPEWRRAA